MCTQITFTATLSLALLHTGMRPVYVFDGKPPQLKTDQLAQRLTRREEATEGLAAAKEAGDAEALEKYSKRTVKVTHCCCFWC